MFWRVGIVDFDKCTNVLNLEYGKTDSNYTLWYSTYTIWSLCETNQQSRNQAVLAFCTLVDNIGEMMYFRRNITYALFAETFGGILIKLIDIAVFDWLSWIPECISASRYYFSLDREILLRN